MQQNPDRKMSADKLYALAGAVVAVHVISDAAEWRSSQLPDSAHLSVPITCTRAPNKWSVTRRKRLADTLSELLFNACTLYSIHGA